MARGIRLAVAHDSGIGAEWVAAHIPEDSGIAIVEQVEGFEGAFERLQQEVDLLVVACATESRQALALVARSMIEHQGRPVLVLASEASGAFVREAFEAGAEDLVVVPEGSGASASATAEVVFAVEKAMARRSASADIVKGSGAMICVLGPKGGIGKTLTSCNLAVSLADRNRRVALVDLDLQFGDLALSLRIKPEQTIYDLATSGGSLDADKMEAFLATHESGVRVLLAPIRPDQAGIITNDFLRDVYRVLTEAYDYVIVDTPPGFTPEVIATIDASSHICMIGMLDTLSLKNTKLGMETLELMGYPPERIRLVLNRADTNVGITHSDVVSILGRAPDVLIPSTRDITRSVNDGTPISMSAKRSEAAKGFSALAEIYDAPPRKATGNKRAVRSLLSRGGG